MHGRCGKRWYKFVVMAIIGIAVGGLVTMALWNWLVPTLFGLTHITFLQALGLLVLGRLLFGGFGGKHCMMHRHGSRHMVERWMQMTPEEREKFMTGMRGCCGSDKSGDKPAEE